MRRWQPVLVLELGPVPVLEPVFEPVLEIVHVHVPEPELGLAIVLDWVVHWAPCMGWDTGCSRYCPLYCDIQIIQSS